MDFSARIIVSLRPSVLDPAGTAVEHSLHQMGYESVAGVRIGKNITLTLQAESESGAREQLDAICDRLLANPAIEDYSFELEPLQAAVG